MVPARRHDRMRRYGAWAGQFAFTLLLTFIGLTAITFFVGRVIPIDPAVAMVGDRAPAEVYQRVRQELNLDEPLIIQYFLYMRDVATGDFGTSVITGRPVSHDTRHFFLATMELSTIGVLFGAGLGIPFGVWAAVRQGRLTDQLIRTWG